MFVLVTFFCEEICKAKGNFEIDCCLDRIDIAGSI